MSRRRKSEGNPAEAAENFEEPVEFEAEELLEETQETPESQESQESQDSSEPGTEVVPEPQEIPISEPETIEMEPRPAKLSVKKKPKSTSERPRRKLKFTR